MLIARICARRNHDEVLELLTATLKVSEKPGLEAFDDRFGAIGDHAQDSDASPRPPNFSKSWFKKKFMTVKIARLLFLSQRRCEVGLRAYWARCKCTNAASEKLGSVGTRQQTGEGFGKSLGWLLGKILTIWPLNHLESSDSRRGACFSKPAMTISSTNSVTEFAKLSGHLIQPVWGTCKRSADRFSKNFWKMNLIY